MPLIHMMTRERRPRGEEKERKNERTRKKRKKRKKAREKNVSRRGQVAALGMSGQSNPASVARHAAGMARESRHQNHYSPFQLRCGSLRWGSLPWLNRALLLDVDSSPCCCLLSWAKMHLFETTGSCNAHTGKSCWRVFPRLHPPRERRVPKLGLLLGADNEESKTHSI